LMQSKTVEVNGLKIAYDIRGSGPPICLVMGIASQLVWWDEEFCNRLAGAGFTVLRFDNRDIGHSSKMSGKPDIATMIPRALLGMKLTAPYTLHEMAGDMVGLWRVLGLQEVHLVGVSMGGMIAQTAAIGWPQHVKSLTSIASTAGGMRHWLSRPQTVLSFVGRKPPRTPEEAVESMVELFRTLHGTKLPFDEQRIRKTAQLAVSRGQNPEGFVRHLAAILASGDRTEALKKLKVPALVIHGTEDPLIPLSAGQACAAAIPNARFCTCSGLGHGLPIAVWDQVLEQVVGLVRGVEQQG
jgi:pimeloyl-ACP methyl ester carboxylesterase